MSHPEEIDFDEPAAVKTTRPDDVDFEFQPPEQVPQVAPMDIVQILPADFPLPALVRFVPDIAIKEVLDDAVAEALAVKVEGVKGLVEADVAMNKVRVAIRVATEHFDEPKRIAYELHRSISGALGTWVSPAAAALDMVSGRFLKEKRRLEAEDAAARRKAQEAADQAAREAAHAAAAGAAKGGAAPDLVAQMQAEAETAKAPPVPVVSQVAASIKGTAVAKKWKARIVSTPAEDDPHPEMDALSMPQMADVFRAMRAVVEGQAPIIIFDINWTKLDALANAQKSTFKLPGFEPWEDEATRAKPAPGGRRRG